MSGLWIHLLEIPFPPDQNHWSNKLESNKSQPSLCRHLLFENHIKGRRESPNVSLPHSVHMEKPLHRGTTKTLTLGSGVLMIREGGRRWWGISEVPSWEVCRMASPMLGLGLWSRQDNQVPWLPCHMFGDQRNRRSCSAYVTVTKTMGLTRSWTEQHMMPPYRQPGSL